MFGSQGNRKKVCLSYQTKVVWQAEEECFYSQIVLWHQWHHCDWQVAKKKLPAWERTLRQEGYNLWAELKANKDQDRATGGEPFAEPPKRIYAEGWDLPEPGYVSEDDIKTMTDSQLLDTLTDQVLRFCKSVSKFS